MKSLFLAILILSLVIPVSCAQTDYNNVLVARVNDGDTFQLSNGERVRLIGIDAPEYWESNKLYRDARKTGRDIKTIQEMGQQAYEFTKGLVEGKRVRLEFDAEKRDKYGRLLAYVFIDTDIERKEGEPYQLDFKHHPDHYYDWFSGKWSHFINATIVKSGHASPMTIPPNVKYADLFQRLYQEARKSNRGLWR